MNKIHKKNLGANPRMKTINDQLQSLIEARAQIQERVKEQMHEEQKRLRKEMIGNNSRPGSGLALAELSLEEESQELKKNMIMLGQNRGASKAELAEMELREEQRLLEEEMKVINQPSSQRVATN